MSRWSNTYGYYTGDSNSTGGRIYVTWETPKTYIVPPKPKTKCNKCVSRCDREVRDRLGKDCELFELSE